LKAISPNVTHPSSLPAPLLSSLFSSSNTLSQANKKIFDSSFVFIHHPCIKWIVLIFIW
jgi:hypothetical protein